MKEANTILLVSNFKADTQHSMLRFSDTLCKIEEPFFTVDEICPKTSISTFTKNRKLKKWASYVDKYLIFPKILGNYIHKKKFDLIHITDQSNSIYLNKVRRVSNVKCLLTCHDLIAVRTALGEFSFTLATSSSGKRLQSWIQHSIPKADYFACDSRNTKKDLNRIIPSSRTRSQVIHLGTEFECRNSKIKSDPKSKLSFNAARTRFILHVGSAAWYKNRSAVFKAFQYAKQQNHLNDFKLVLVGPSPQADEVDARLKKWLDNNSRDIISLTNVSELALHELYINAEFLIFPSYIEGFGWPPLEAVSIGCPVITTKTGAIFDILGNVANFIIPDYQQNINETVFEALENKLKPPPNVSVPTNKLCRKEYYNLYQHLIKN